MSFYDDVYREMLHDYDDLVEADDGRPTRQELELEEAERREPWRFASHRDENRETGQP